MMKIKGVDLSYCQEVISFPVLKQAGVRFAIIRAGFSTKKDVTMDKFVADCKKYGVDYGFYWYSYAMNVGQAQTEAEKCIEVIKNLSPTYPVFFDMEEKKQISGLNTDTRTKMAIAFCEKIRQAGFKPGIYANPSFMENYYDKSRMVNRYNEIYRLQMPSITPHVCRHTYCSNMARSGMNPKTLQYLMGHSDIGVTLNTYTHLGQHRTKSTN